VSYARREKAHPYGNGLGESDSNSGGLVRIAETEPRPTVRCMSERWRRAPRQLREYLACRTRYVPQQNSRTGCGKLAAYSWSIYMGL